jgi:hypothetical protein
MSLKRQIDGSLLIEMNYKSNLYNRKNFYCFADEPD